MNYAPSSLLSFNRIITVDTNSFKNPVSKEKIKALKKEYKKSLKNRLTEDTPVGQEVFSME